MGKPAPIRIFTETTADACNINAQSLTVREIFSRLSPTEFEVAMPHQSDLVDPRIQDRPSTRLIRGGKHGKTFKYITHCLAFRPDIYFYPQPSPVTDIFLRLKKHLGLKAKVVVHVVSSYSLSQNLRRDWFGADALVRSIREGNVVVGNSRFVSADVERVFGRKAATIHNGIDRRNFYPLEPSKSADETVKVLFVGSFRPYKRPQMVVEAAARFQNATFVMIGDGEEKAACEALAKSLPKQNLKFMPNMLAPQLGQIMRDMDIFFFPSAIEGHPQVLGQAAASGLPCVAMNCYEPDYVVDGVTGFLAANDGDLFQSLGRLIESHELRNKMRQAAIAHSRQFDWDTITEQWAALFRSIIHETGKA